jgi:hypothetical protein
VGQGVIEIVVGVVLIVVGLTIVVKREAAARHNLKALRQIHGDRANSAVRNSTPARMALIGAVATILGASLLVHRLVVMWAP